MESVIVRLMGQSAVSDEEFVHSFYICVHVLFCVCDVRHVCVYAYVSMLIWACMQRPEVHLRWLPLCCTLCFEMRSLVQLGAHGGR